MSSNDLERFFPGVRPNEVSRFVNGMDWIKVGYLKLSDTRDDYETIFFHDTHDAQVRHPHVGGKGTRTQL